MKEDKNNIEKLFKEKFDNFEAEPKPYSWRKIAAVIGGVGATVAGGGAAYYLSFGKIVAIASVVGSVSVGGYFLLKGNKLQVIAENKNNVAQQHPVDSQTMETTVAMTDSSVSYAPKLEKSEEIANTENGKTIVALPVIQNEKYNVEPKTTSDAVSKTNKVSAVSGEKPVSVKESQLTAQQKKIYQKKAETSSSLFKHIPNKKPEISPEQANEERNTNAYYNLASIFASPVSGYTPLSVKLTNTGAAKSNIWKFDDGSQPSYELNPTHIFDRVGRHKVILTSVDNYRKETDTITIYVYGIGEIANVFSPNGDGINDVFKINSYGLVSINVTIIHSATGSELYKWNSLEGSWDGRMPDGEMASAGTYLYTFEAEGRDGKKYSVTKGQIKIQR